MKQPDRAPLSENLEDALDANALADVWVRIGTERTRGPRTAARTLSVLALAASIVLATHLVGEPESGPLTRADAAPLSAVPSNESLALADGSRVTTSPEAELQVIENRGDRIEWRLARGRARFDVRPHGPRRWHVVSAGVSVEVSGTTFVVDRTVERVRVSVLEGVVLVRHASLPDGVRRIEKGEHVEVALSTRRATLAAAPAAPEGVSTAADVPALEVDSAALLRRADEARRTHRLSAAVEALELIVSRHPRSHEAPLAAFTLGRLEEDLGHPGGAARAYRRAVTLGLREPLREEAHARWAEAAALAGDAPGAREASRLYETRYPSGVHVARLRALGAE